MAEVPRKRTPIGEQEAAQAIIEQIIPNFGKESFVQHFAELLLAQVWLETGRGSSTMNNNWGNITASNTWPGDFWRPVWYDKDEVLAMPDGATKNRYLKLHEEMLAHRAPSKFRAYPTKEAGLRDYINQLKVNFPSIPKAAMTGDPLVFTTAIRDSRYAPDIVPSKHAPTIAALVEDFRKKGLFSSLPKAEPAAHSEQFSSSEPPSVSSGAPYESGLEDLPVLREGSKGTAVELFRALTIGGRGRLMKEDIKRIKSWQTAHRLPTIDGIVGNKESWPALIKEVGE